VAVSRAEVSKPRAVKVADKTLVAGKVNRVRIKAGSKVVKVASRVAKAKKVASR
jgi:hypothetical protein